VASDPASLDVLTMGRVGVDIYPLQAGVAQEDVTTFGRYLGGSATNFAVVAARLGRSAAVITRTGNDPFGRFVHHTRARVSSEGGGRFALACARAGKRIAPRYGPASAVPVELRGAGACSRRVHNFCMPVAFPADRLIAREVLTPAGNWSSYPPHKHDEERPGDPAHGWVRGTWTGQRPDPRLTTPGALTGGAP
jgi:5-deoxy-D-glucuronate isomerase